MDYIPETSQRLNNSIKQVPDLDTSFKMPPSSPIHSIWFSSSKQSLNMIDSVNEILFRTGKLQVKRNVGG